MSKKLFAIIAIGAMFVSGIQAPTAQAATIVDGGEYTCTGGCFANWPSSAVFLVQGTNLYAYASANVWRTYHPDQADFSTVITVSSADLASYTVKGYVSPKVGTFVKAKDTSFSGAGIDVRTVYLVGLNGVFHPVYQASIYKNWTGDSTWKNIYTLPDAFTTVVVPTMGSVIDSSVNAPEGMAAMNIVGDYGYVGAGNTFRAFSSQAALDANKFNKTMAARLSSSLSAGSTITGAESGYVAFQKKETTSTPPTGGSATVALASTTAPSANLSSSTLYNPMLTVRFTAGSNPVNVTGLTVTKGGLSANSAVSGISVWDMSGNRHANIVTSLTSDNKATFLFPSNPISVPANGYADVVVKANFTGTAGTVYFSVTALTDVLTNGTLTGVFPLVGNTMTLFNGSSSVGDLCINATSVGGQTASSSAANVEIGATEKKVFDISLYQENSVEDMYVDRIVVYVEGNLVENSDVQNWKLYAPDNTLLATATKPVDRYVTFNLASPYKVAKGMTKILAVKADVLDGSARYFKAHIQNDYDVMFRGSTSGVYVAPEANTGSCTTFADESASDGWWIMKSGNMVVTKSSSSTSGNIAQGSEGVVLGKFDLKATGENLEVRKMYVTYDYSDADPTDLTGNVVIRDTDGNVYGSVAASTTNIDTSTGYEVTLSSYINLTTNVTKTIEIVGNVSSSATGSYKAAIKSFYVKRLSTIDYTTLSTTFTQANTLTVTSAALTGGKDTSMGNKNLAPGSSNQIIGKFVLSAGSAENINLNTISVGFNTSSASSQMVNLALYEGSTQLGSTVASPDDTSNAFSVGLTINKNATKTITVKADVLSSATVGNYVKVVAVTGIGGSTSNSITGQYASADISTSNAIPLQTITFTSATATVAKDTSAPLSQIFTPSGSDYVAVHTIKISANYEALTLNKITFKINPDTDSTADTAAKLAPCFGSIALYDGATQLGTTSLNGSTYDAVFSGLNVAIGADSYKNLTLKAQINASGTMLPAAVGSWRVKSITSTDFELQGGSGLISSGNITLTDNGESNYHMYHNTVPVIAVSTDTPSSTQKSKHAGSATESIFKFTVTASGARDLTFGNIPVRVYTSGIDSNDSVTSFKLYDETGTLLDTDSTTLDATTTYATITFVPSPAVTMNAGSTKTFTVKADTSAMTVLSTATATLYGQVSGAAGYSNSTSVNEYEWSDGDITYGYTPVGESASGTIYSGSNSYLNDLNGGTLVY